MLPLVRKYGVDEKSVDQVSPFNEELSHYSSQPTIPSLSGSPIKSSPSSATSSIPSLPSLPSFASLPSLPSLPSASSDDTVCLDSLPDMAEITRTLSAASFGSKTSSNPQTTMARGSSNNNLSNNADYGPIPSKVSSKHSHRAQVEVANPTSAELLFRQAQSKKGYLYTSYIHYNLALK